MERLDPLGRVRQGGHGGSGRTWRAGRVDLGFGDREAGRRRGGRRRSARSARRARRRPSRAPRPGSRPPAAGCPGRPRAGGRSSARTTPSTPGVRVSSRRITSSRPGLDAVAAAAAATSRRIASMRALTRAWAVFSEARLTMSRAVEVMIWATSTRPLARSVSPDWTRSTMRSARPDQRRQLDGAVEPDHLHLDPALREVVLGERGILGGHAHPRPLREGSSRSQSSRASATTRRQKPKPRSTGSYTSGSCSARMSLPTMPRSAAPYST